MILRHVFISTYYFTEGPNTDNPNRYKTLNCELKNFNNQLMVVYDGKTVIDLRSNK
jgi:hypothetical protein